MLHFTSLDPLAEKNYNESTYIYCGNNPISRIDPDGMDWYQDNKGNTFWQKGNAKSVTRNVVTYSNIRGTFTQDIGNGVSVTYNQNNAASMTFTGISEDNFVSQSTGTGCKVACDKMLAEEGANSKGERVNVANSDANGVTTTVNSNASKGVKAVVNAFENGKPVEVAFIINQNKLTT